MKRSKRLKYSRFFFLLFLWQVSLICFASTIYNQQQNEQLSLCVEDFQDVDDDASEDSQPSAEDCDSHWEVMDNFLNSFTQSLSFFSDPRVFIPKKGHCVTHFSPPELIANNI